MKEALTQAAKILKEGGVVGMPTETVYGLAGWIESEIGLRKIFSTKERPFFDPLIVHVASLDQAKYLTCNWHPLNQFLAENFWPGPMTLVVPKASHVNSLITSGLETVGIRLPSHPVAQELIRLVGPLAAPSANKFGKTSPTCKQHVEAEFGGEVFTLEGGTGEIGIESSIFQVEETASKLVLNILRPGIIGEEQLTRLLQKYPEKVIVKRNFTSIAPGQLKHHYMPAIPLVLIENRNELLRLKSEFSMTFQRPTEMVLSSEPNLAARELYATMRTLSTTGADLIYLIKSKYYHSSGWEALRDRLEKAATVNLQG